MEAEGRDDLRAREIIDTVLDKPEPPAPSKRSHSRDVYNVSMSNWRRSVIQIMAIQEIDRIILEVAGSFSDVQVIEEKCTFEEIAIMYAQKRIS